MPTASESLIQCDPEVFSRNFNRLPPAIQCTLADHLLFQLPALAEQVQSSLDR
jgi:hypothetical protein